MVRFILNLGPRHSINCDILDCLNMLNVEARVKQLRLNHVFNIVQGLAPNYLQENFTLVFSTSRYATRSSSNRNFIVPQISTYEAGTFYYSAIKDWNGLPVNIKEITNKDTFKDALKQFLKQQSRECEIPLYTFKVLQIKIQGVLVTHFIVFLMQYQLSEPKSYERSIC